MTFAWSGLSLEEIKAGSQSTLIFRARPAARLPDAGGAVRKPHAAVHHSAVGAAGDPRRAARAVGPRADRRRVLPDRARDADRPVGEERDPDRRVRRAAPRARLSIADAAVEAARIRLRPILMTSLAFILGVMPLVFATGAGRAARHSVGTAVAGGMIASTFLNLAFIPVLYVVVKSLGARNAGAAPEKPASCLKTVRVAPHGLARCRHPASHPAQHPGTRHPARHPAQAPGTRCACSWRRAWRSIVCASARARRTRDVSAGDRSRDEEQPVGRGRRRAAFCAPRVCSPRRARRDAAGDRDGDDDDAE